MTTLQHITGRAIWLVLGGVALLAVLSFRSGDLPLDQWIAGGKIELQTNRTLLARYSTYVQQSSRARKRLSDSIGTILSELKDSQTTGVARLATAQTADQMRAAAFTFARAGQVCAETLVLCRARGDSLFRADSVHTDSLRVALQRADSVLQRGIEVARCHFLVVLGCLSRTRSLEVGLIGGLLVGVLVHR